MNGPPSLPFADRVVVITGAGRGIGRVLSLRYAGAGASVVIAGRTPAPLEETAELVRRDGGVVHVVPADIRVEGDCAALVRLAV